MKWFWIPNSESYTSATRLPAKDAVLGDILLASGPGTDPWTFWRDCESAALRLEQRAGMIKQKNADFPTGIAIAKL